MDLARLGGAGASSPWNHLPNQVRANQSRGFGCGQVPVRCGCRASAVGGGLKSAPYRRFPRRRKVTAKKRARYRVMDAPAEVPT